MPKSISALNRLLEKANQLPLSPGVYIMRDKQRKVLYVGKSRKLKNRVSQYFQNNKKNVKTSRMVALIEDFEYIVCKTEIEALTLENALIKQYSPKYNIKLKDAKSYPYIKITAGEFPRIVYTRSRIADKAKYFGPFSGTATVYSILDILHKSLGIPSCKRVFPKEIGKERPCIYYQMKQCCGVCTGEVTAEEYGQLIHCAADILRGHTGAAAELLEKQMRSYAEKEQFEAAARCRDTIRALRQVTQKQHVVASPETNMDVFGFYSEDDTFFCMSALYIRDGALASKRDFVFGSDTLIDSDALHSFLIEHYMICDYIPKQIMISFPLEEEDREALEAFLCQKGGHRIEIRHPERGTARALCYTAVENAEAKMRQVRIEAQKDESVLIDLSQILGLEILPERIEAYDISNLGRENITAGMVAFVNGKPQKSDYRSFRIRSVSENGDDYASMAEALERRFAHLKADQSGAFSKLPDLILVDGGKGHVAVARETMQKAGLSIPIFGMVKDDYHKTRALCTDHEEINIAREKAVFMLIYKIQEEVHRFTVGRMTNAKRKTIKHSSLEKIDGIGPIKAKKLLGAMGTLSAVKSASVEALASVSGVTEKDARAVWRYFHGE